MAKQNYNKKKQTYKKPEPEKLEPEKKIETDKLEKERSEKIETEKVKKYKVKSAKQIGFEKRNYYMNSINKNVLIVAEGEVDESTYNAFSDKTKAKFFE